MAVSPPKGMVSGTEFWLSDSGSTPPAPSAEPALAIASGACGDLGAKVQMIQVVFDVPTRRCHVPHTVGLTRRQAWCHRVSGSAL